MAKLSDFVQFKTVRGTVVHTPHHRLVPESQALTVRFPYGGFVWQRPTAVLLQEDDQVRRLPIIDVTRTAVWSILGLSLLLFLVLRQLSGLQSGRLIATEADHAQ